MANKRPITTPASLAELPNTDSLIAGESAVLVEQSVSPGTPPSGYGIVYAKTDGKLYFKNDVGTETDLTATGGGGTNPVINEYTSNDTWTKPTAANFWGIMVVCCGGGGGGSSGRRGAINTSRGGAGAGGGGALSYRFLRAANLPNASYLVTIGSGGNGGASQTLDNNNGLIGTVGGTTSFGSLVIATFGNRGSAGTGGSASGGQGGSSADCIPARGPFATPGGNGGGANIGGTAGSSNAAFQASVAQSGAAPGGGGGGSISSTNVQFNAGIGAGVYDASNTVKGQKTAGTIPGGNGNNGDDDVANNLLFDIDNVTVYGVGSAGSGGACGDTAGTIAGGNGGNGGRGAGGGGGGASTNGANSGAGGSGGGGFCFVVEYYGA